MSYTILNHNMGNIKGPNNILDVMDITKTLMGDIDLCCFQELIMDKKFTDMMSNFEFMIKDQLSIAYNKKRFTFVSVIDHKFKNDRILTVNLKDKGMIISVSSIHSPLRNYRSGGESHYDNFLFLDYLSDILDGKIDVKASVIIIAGDFNKRLVNSKTLKPMYHKNPLSLHMNKLISPIRSTTKSGLIDAIFFKAIGIYDKFHIVSVNSELIDSDDRFDHSWIISKITVENKIVGEEKFRYYLSNGERRFVHEGSNGGLYYFTPGYHKEYVNDKKFGFIEKDKIVKWSIYEGYNKIIERL